MGMRTRDYFPLGIATGNAFCNRTDDIKLLVDNIKNGKHTLLIATRRYGKSSLALKAIHLAKLPHTEADFYMASHEKAIEAYILNSTVELIGRALGPLEKLVSSIKKYIKNLTPKINIGTNHFNLELQSDTTIDPASNVKEALLLLENLLAEKGKQAVFLMDEFQNVGMIAQGKGIEAAIRHVAQKTKYLTIIFSGSNRHLLQTMFEDENRPLYKLCWKMTLSRIAAAHYERYIQTVAKTTWKKLLPEDVFSAIMILSARHPYYVNKLCDRIWTFFEKMPTLNDVETAWLDVLQEEKSDAVKEISLLSSGQKNVLLHIAKHTSPQLTSKESLMAMEMTGSSVMTALHGLEEKDIIERHENNYQIVNPVVKYYALKGAT